MAKPKTRKHRIFVLEDDRASRRLITRCLDEAGYEAIEFHETKDALHSAELWPPSVMIVDVMLPDMQGTEFVALMRENPDLQDIRIVFLTGILKGKPTDNDYRFKIGSDFFPALSKPINFPQLLKEIANELERAKVEKLQKEKAAERKAQQPEEAEGSASTENDGPEAVFEFPNPTDPEKKSEKTKDLEYDRGDRPKSRSVFF